MSLGLGSMEVIREINKRGKLTYTRTSWAKWMTGTIPRTDARRALGDVLEIPHTTFAKVAAKQERDKFSASEPTQEAELSVPYADAGESPPGVDGEDVQRREFLERGVRVTAAALTSASIDWERLANGLALADQDFIERARGSVQHLVLLDNQVGPDQIAGVAAQLFRTVTRRLRQGRYRPSIEADLMATAAEVGELAGWLLYDANRHDEAGKVNEAALYWATLAKDQGMADFILTNAGLQAIHLRRAGEAMQVTARLLDGEDKMSPRVRALARVRRGRARAIAGDATGAARDFEAARSLYLDGVRSSDPSWAWWVDEILVTGHGALCRHESGDLKGAVDLFHRAIELCPENRPRDRFMWHVHLLGTLVEMKEWDHAGEVAERAAPFVGDVACGRVVAVLRDSIRRIDRAEGVPLPLRDGVHHLDRVLIEVGYPATI
jgi:hypothetical protein